eukprot:gene3726-4647_t
MPGDYEDATELCDEILATNPAHLLAMKRKVCIFKSQGDTKAALELLQLIVSVYQSDISSWLESAELFASVGDFQSAAFCYEETILISPSIAPYHVRLAEIYYTIAT